MLNTRGHVSKAINYNCQCVFEGSTELGVIIYSVIIEQLKIPRMVLIAFNTQEALPAHPADAELGKSRR